MAYMLHISSINSDKHAQVLPHPPNYPLLPLHLVLPGAIRSSFLCRILRPSRSVPGGMQSVCATLPSSIRICCVLILSNPPCCRNDPTCVCANDGFIGAVYSCVWQSCSNSDAQTAVNYWNTACGGYGPSSGTGIRYLSKTYPVLTTRNRKYTHGDFLKLWPTLLPARVAVQLIRN